MKVLSDVPVYICSKCGALLGVSHKDIYTKNISYRDSYVTSEYFKCICGQENSVARSRVLKKEDSYSPFQFGF